MLHSFVCSNSLRFQIKEFVSERKRMEFEPCGGGISRGPPPLSFKDTSEITRMLNEIESKHDVKILLAVGSGIKEWSLESTNIDIQFVFYRPLNLSKYLPNLPNASVSASDIIALASSAKRSNERGGSRKRFTGYNINELMKLVGEMYPPVVEMFYSATLHRLDERFATCVQLIRDVLEDTDQITKLVKNHGKVAESMIKFYKGARNDGQLSLDQLTQVARAIVAFEWQLLMYYAPYSIDEKTLACMRLVELNFENMLNDLRTHDSKISFNRIIPNDEIYDALKALVKKRLTSLSNDKVDDDLKWMDDLVVNTSKKIARMQLADSETSSRIANMVETVYNSMLDSLFNS